MTVSTFPYRLRKRLMREIRALAGGLDVALDRGLFRTRVASKNPKERFLAIAGITPWRDNEDLGFVSTSEQEAVLGKADEVCRHEFDLLGSGLVQLGDEIDWHTDFKTGYRWDSEVHYSRIRWDQAPEGSDIKVPWELSRCQHFATLGLADRLCGDENYYHEFKDQVRSWIRSNPVSHGVNWICAMDVALRAVNWINAIMLFHGRIGDDEDEAFFSELEEALWMAGLHVSRNLEWQGPRSGALGNHFLANLSGLLGLGLLFGPQGAGRNWFQFAKRWFEVEIQRQVNSDGSSHETSTSYHRLVMEMYLWASALCDAAGEPFSGEFRGRLRGMAAFVTAYTSPSREAAQFGDNDSGRVLACGIGNPRDHRYLTASEAGTGGAIDRWMLCGGQGPADLPGARTGAFPEGGFWFMELDGAWLGVRAGPVTHHGAHAHSDQMSFVLAVSGSDLLVDPGTGVYSADPKKRNRYRSSRAHNACYINDWEANSFAEGKAGLFQMGDDTKTEILDWRPNERDSLIVGRHFGFERYRSGLACERSLALHCGSLEIRDRLELLEPGDRLNWSFHFAPGVEIVREAGSVVACAGNCRIRIVPDSGIEAVIADAFLSPAYGVELPCVRLNLTALVTETGTGDYGIRFEWAAPDA